MDYEKKYKDALERARKSHDKANGLIKKEWIETIFPELKENEDEKIRKQILSFLKEFECDHCRSTNFSSWIAWLEKQGVQKPTDAIELRFKIGDWVVNKFGHVWHIDSFDNKNYQVSNEKGDDCYFKISQQDEMHLWTIADADEGDVLVCDSSKHGQEIGIVKEYVGKQGGCDSCFDTYCFVDWDGNLIVSEYMGSRDIHPATKEQRDLLFQKMEKAGYEWDAEKKELYWI